MNDIEGQEVKGEQGCEGARVPDYQEHVEDEVQNIGNDISHFTMISIKSVDKEEDLCVSEKTSREGGDGVGRFGQGLGGEGGGWGGGEGGESDGQGRGGEGGGQGGGEG